MSIPRLSYGLVARSGVRAHAAAGASSSLMRSGGAGGGAQIRTQIRGKEDLGGPGGQQPAPKQPGGPEAVKRNWVPIAGGALAILAGYAYFSGGKQPSKEEVQAALRDAQSEGKDALRSSGQELAGRKGDKGAFRSE